MKIKKIISAALTCVLVSVSLPVFEKNPVAAESLDWQEYYRNTLYEFKESDDYTELSRFELHDLSGDDIPELIISEGDYHAAGCKIYTYFNNEFIDLGELGSFGQIGFITIKDTILSYHIGQGVENIDCYHLKNGRSLTNIVSFYNTAGAATPDRKAEYQMNGKVVSEKYYSDAYSNYETDKIQWLGLANEFDDESIEAAISAFDIPPVNSNWRDVYKEVLTNYKEGSYYSPDTMFDLYDLDGDGIPELIISDGSDSVNRCRIYSVYNNKSNYLGEYRQDYNGTLSYSPASKIIISICMTNNHTYYDYCKIENGVILRTFSCNRTSSYENDSYVVNEKIVTKETYDEELNKYQESLKADGQRDTIYIGRRYQLGDSAIDYALNPPDTSLTEEQRKLYAQKLYKTLSNGGPYISSSSFDLCDINKDGTPELIISPAGYYREIYTIHNGELIEFKDTEFPGPINYDVEKEIFYDTYNPNCCPDHDMHCISNYWEIKNDKITTLLECSFLEGYQDADGNVTSNSFTVNGETVSESAYNSALSKYNDINNTIVLGDRYNFNNKNIASALFLNGNDATILTQMKTFALAANVIPFVGLNK